MYKSLNTADLHLTSRKNDDYRWEIFSWLGTQLDDTITHINILGDLTDFKDGHDAKLVNWLITGLCSLSKVPIYILLGNHDYVDPSLAYFKFLSKLPNVKFITKPTSLEICGKDCLYLPHTHKVKEDWKDIDFSGYYRIFLHQCLLGSKTPDGRTLDGLDSSIFDNIDDSCKVLAGDIHTNQQVGKVTYIGAPYPVVHGDNYVPRIILDDGELHSIKVPSIRKITARIKHPDDLVKFGINEGDQIKVIFDMSKSDYVNFADYKKGALKYVTSLGGTVNDVSLGKMESVTKKAQSSPQTGEDAGGIYKRYCESNGLKGELVVAGGQFLEV